jgi:RimJ/RimL family protein N-acetyltransferase
MVHMGGVRSNRVTADYFEHNLSHWAEHGYGIWVLRDRATKCFVGRGGLRHAVLTGRADVELAYGLMPQFWGRGLATEFACAAVRIGLTDLGLKSVVGITVPDNLASCRVMEKVGFVYERDVTVKGVVNVLYRLDDAQHLKGRSHVRER